MENQLVVKLAKHVIIKLKNFFELCPRQDGHGSSGAWGLQASNHGRCLWSENPFDINYSHVTKSSNASIRCKNMVIIMTLKMCLKPLGGTILKLAAQGCCISVGLHVDSLTIDQKTLSRPFGKRWGLCAFQKGFGYPKEYNSNALQFSWASLRNEIESRIGCTRMWCNTTSCHPP